MTVLCTFGFHKWNQTTWRTDGDKCLETRKCSLCSKEEILQVQEHLWKDSTWKSSNSFGRSTPDEKCLEIRKCSHCAKEETLQSVEHVWSEWRAVEAKCEEHRRCNRCGRSDTRYLKHDWGPWVHNNVSGQGSKRGVGSSSRRVCKRCSLEERRVVDWERY